MDGEGEGYGSLFSIVLKRKDSARVFYDRLDTAKGPPTNSNTSRTPYIIRKKNRIVLGIVHVILLFGVTSKVLLKHLQ